MHCCCVCQCLHTVLLYSLSTVSQAPRPIMAFSTDRYEKDLGSIPMTSLCWEDDVQKVRPLCDPRSFFFSPRWYCKIKISTIIGCGWNIGHPSSCAWILHGIIQSQTRLFLVLYTWRAVRKNHLWTTGIEGTNDLALDELVKDLALDELEVASFLKKVLRIHEVESIGWNKVFCLLGTSMRTVSSPHHDTTPYQSS